MTDQNQSPETPRVQPKALTLRGFVKNAEAVVAQQKGNMALKMQKGSLGSMEAYHRDVGRAEGMDMAIGLMKDMLQQLEDAQRDEDLPEM